jgi:tRNA wybutosine-synthesizing protein 2
MARPPKKKKENPIRAAITSWLESLPLSLLETLTTQLGNPSTNDTAQQLLDRAPKRWVAYEPMVLLPSGSFTSPPWPSLLDVVTPTQKSTLWTAILSSLSPPSKPSLTHLAINSGIPLHLTNHQQEENLLRSPSGLIPLSGSFGEGPSSATPTTTDFTTALWVSTKQNGIHQTWAPRYTMFSRGNVKEKARLLSFSSSSDSPPPLHPNPHRSPSQPQQQQKQPQQWAVDLYAGIGYFTFSYAALGLRVLCWEINPWSVEGLRRGAEMNGWSVRVIDPSQDGEEVDMKEVLSSGGGAQIVVFLEDNCHAAKRIREARRMMGMGGVVHVNCGFLPSSEGVWRDAWEIQDGDSGWLHLHENVGVEEVEGRKGEIQGLLDAWRGEEEGEGGKEGKVRHVELVKTFAPGVWHCVFDVFITKSSAVK